MNRKIDNETLKREREQSGRPISATKPITPTQSTVGQYNIVFQEEESIYRDRSAKE